MIVYSFPTTFPKFNTFSKGIHAKRDLIGYHSLTLFFYLRPHWDLIDSHSSQIPKPIFLFLFCFLFEGWNFQSPRSSVLILFLSNSQGFDSLEPFHNLGSCTFSKCLCLGLGFIWNKRKGCMLIGWRLELGGQWKNVLMGISSPILLANIKSPERGYVLLLLLLLLLLMHVNYLYFHCRKRIYEFVDVFGVAFCIFWWCGMT